MERPATDVSRWAGDGEDAGGALATWLPLSGKKGFQE